MKSHLIQYQKQNGLLKHQLFPKIYINNTKGHTSTIVTDFKEFTVYNGYFEGK